MSAHIDYNSDWKDMQDLYVCQNNVWVEAKELYACKDNAWGLVWPIGGTDYGDECDLLAKSMIAAAIGQSSYGGTQNGTIRTQNADTGYAQISAGPSNIFPTTSDYGKFWWQTTQIDTRSYGYILCHWRSWSDNTYWNAYGVPFVSYYDQAVTGWSVLTENNTHASNTVQLFSGAYILFDITKMRQENTYVYFGCYASNYTDNTAIIDINMDECTLYKQKPSVSVDCEVVWS